MSRYDGLIIPRSYSEYINKTDAATLSQALQQSGVMDAAPTSGSNHPVKSGGVFTALNSYRDIDVNGNYFSTGYKITYAKQGCVCNLQARLLTKTSVPTNTVIANIPNWWTQRILKFAGFDANNNLIIMLLDDTGQLKLVTPMATGEEIRFSFTIIVDTNNQ